MSEIIWDLALIQKYNQSGPRYTSYPTALEFNESYTNEDFIAAANRYPERPLSLYVTHSVLSQNFATSVAVIR